MNRPLLIHNGPILTMNREQPLAEAVLCQFGRIVAVGALDDVRSHLAGPADELDLQGRLAVPGLNDAHAHPDLVGFALGQIGLAAPGVTSIAQIRDLVRAEAERIPPGTWIVGRGYDQATLVEGRHPTRQDLDDIAPEHPVLLWRSCHHIAVANSRALALAGIDRTTGDEPDGTIDRDDHGEPTGVLRESMSKRAAAAQPAASEDDYVEALRRAGQEFRRFGVTSVTDALVRTPIHLRAYQRLRSSGELPVRSTLMMIIDDTLDELVSLGIVTGFGDDWLQIGAAKLFADGSIGGRTARLRAPYAGEPDNYGLWMISPDEIRERVIRAHDAGFQVGIHAIGDAAIDAVLDAYEAAQEHNPRPDPRHRIEHCSLVDLVQMDRIKQLGAVPIPGTTFLYYTRPAYLQNLGPDRVRYAYAMKTFADLGIVAAASSDAPVVPLDPLLGIQTMVTRRDRLGDEIFSEECVPLEEAIRAYTANAAYATRSEERKGTLRPGYLADITVFSTDLRDVASNELASQSVSCTIADGQVVYEAN